MEGEVKESQESNLATCSRTTGNTNSVVKTQEAHLIIHCSSQLEADRSKFQYWNVIDNSYSKLKVLKIIAWSLAIPELQRKVIMQSTTHPSKNEKRNLT